MGVCDLRRWIRLGQWTIAPASLLRTDSPGSTLEADVQHQRRSGPLHLRPAAHAGQGLHHGRHRLGQPLVSQDAYRSRPTVWAGCLVPGCQVFDGPQEQLTDLSASLAIYPNPAQDHVNVRLELPATLRVQGPLRLAVTSLDGRLVHERQVPLTFGPCAHCLGPPKLGEGGQLPTTASWPSGTYFVLPAGGHALAGGGGGLPVALPTVVTLHPPSGPVRARIALPGSKSVANRALVCAALAGRNVRGEGPSRSDRHPDPCSSCCRNALPGCTAGWAAPRCGSRWPGRRCRKGRSGW